MDTALHLVCVIEGVAVPVLEYAGGWAIGSDDSFNLVLPGVEEFENLKPSTHVHIFLAESTSFSWRRRTATIDRNKIHDKIMWFEENIKTLIDIQEDQIRFPSEAWESFNLKDGVSYSGLKYRGGGEISGCVKVVSASKSTSYVVNVTGYSSLLTRMQSIQLLGRRGGLSDVEIRMMGQHTPVYPGKGRNKYYSGVVDDLKKQSKDLLHLNYFMIRKFAAKINKMWRNRIPWARLPNQVIGIDEDVAAKFIVDGPDFKKLLKEVLQGQQILPLRGLTDLLLQLINYRVVPVPTPAYFPLVPSNPRGKKMVEQEVPARSGGWRVRVHFQPYEAYVFPPGWVVGLPEGYQTWITRYGSYDYASSEFRITKRTVGVAGWDQYVLLYLQSIGNVIPLERKILKGGPVNGSARINRDKSVTVTWTNPPDHHGGPAAYTQTLTTAMIVRSNNEELVFHQLEPDEDIWHSTPSDGFRNTHVNAYLDMEWGLRQLRPGYVVYADKINNLSTETIKGRPQIDFGFEFIRSPPRPATTKMVEVEGEEIIPGEYTNSASRLNTYAYLPKLWWAQFPISNVVMPTQLIGTVQISKPSATEITRMIAKVPMGRSGHRQTYANTVPAPTPRDLNEAIPDEASAFDPKDLLFSEYAQGVNAEILFLETLFRAVKEDKWKEYLKSFVTSSFWDKRMESRMASFTMSFDPNIVVGAPLLVMTSRDVNGDNATYGGMTPEQRHLLNRLAALQALRKALRKCIKGLPGDSLLRHLYVCFNQITIYSSTIHRPASFGFRGNLQVPVGANVDIHLSASSGIPGLVSRWRKANTAENIVDDDYFKSLGCKRFRGRYVYTTNGSAWTVSSAQRALGTSNYADLGVTQSDFEKAFNGTNSINISLNFINKLLAFLNSEARNRAAANIQACNSAIRRDIDKITKAIKETNALLRKYRGDVGQVEGYIGYVTSVQDSWSADSHTASMNVTLSHVRKVGEDLDWDSISGDDVENVISFGENALHDERYERERIGKEVYRPIFGTVTPLEVPELKDHLMSLREAAAENVEEAVEGLPPADAQDVIDTFEHPAVCGHNCKDHMTEDDGVPGITEYEVASAIMDWYRDSVARNGETNTQLIFKRWKTRAVMNFSEAYAGFPVVWGTDEVDYDVRDDLGDYLMETYADLDAPVAGFFSTSFVGAFDRDDLFDRITPRKESDVDKEDPKITENEKKLLAQRGAVPLEALTSLEGRTYS